MTAAVQQAVWPQLEFISEMNQVIHLILEVDGELWLCAILMMVLLPSNVEEEDLLEIATDIKHMEDVSDTMSQEADTGSNNTHGEGTPNAEMEQLLDSALQVVTETAKDKPIRFTAIPT